MIDAAGFIAEVRVGAAFPDDPLPAVKYVVGDHLGSAAVAADDTGAWVNREEYTPYGETSFGSYSRKRYRFTGKARDAESGLCYHGARYYAPHLARWANCDPGGGPDGPNLYSYVRCNPNVYTDPTGQQSEDVTWDTGELHCQVVNGTTSCWGAEEVTVVPQPPAEPDFWSRVGGIFAAGLGPLALITPASLPLSTPGTGGGPLTTPGPLNDVMIDDPAFRYAYRAPPRIISPPALTPGVATGEAVSTGGGVSAAGDLLTLFSRVGIPVAVVTTITLICLTSPPDLVPGPELYSTKTNQTIALAGPQDHHIFPREFENEFKDIGITDIDAFTVTVSEAVHQKLHNKVLWNFEWHEFFYGIGAKPTIEAAKDLANWLLHEGNVTGFLHYYRNPKKPSPPL